MTGPTIPERIARAHHCPLGTAKGIYRREYPWQRAVLAYGPMRCWFKYGERWILDGKHIDEAKLGERWRDLCDSGDVANVWSNTVLFDGRGRDS